MEAYRNMNCENLECWRKAKDLTIEIHTLTANNNLNSDHSLKNALRKSSVSIMTHIALGNEHENPEELIKYLECARASLATFRTYLIIIREFGYISEGDYLDLEDHCVHIAALLHSHIKSKTSKPK